MEKENLFTYKSAKEATGFLLWQVHNYWQREIKKALKPFDLTHTQFVILTSAYWLVLNEKKAITQVVIAKYAKTDIMMTSNILRTLERKKYIIRENHKTDTRAKIIFISQKGECVLSKAIKAVEGFDRQFFKLTNSKIFNNELIDILNTSK